MSHRRDGFTLIELLVVIAIIAVLAGMLIPIIASAREKARQAQCISNQRQLSLAITIYAQDHGKFPGFEWAGVIDINNRQVLSCPSNTEDGQGYAMNTFLHNTRPDIVTKPQMIVVTCDSNDSSTFEGDFTRHKKGCIFSHVDGSAVYVKKPEDAGRFSSGLFPLQPIIGVGGAPVNNAPMQPKGFRLYPANTVIASEFLICGPYGDGQGDGVTSSDAQLGFDYIGEKDFASSTADAAPTVGDLAPSSDAIFNPLPADQLAANTNPPKLIRRWARGYSTTLQGTNGVILTDVHNYNAYYDKKTTYAGTFIYSETRQDAVLTAVIDDLGNVWLNGYKVLTDKKAVPVGNETNTANVTIPAGVSFIFMRVTNYSPGAGAKFNIKFDKPVYASYNLP